MKHERTRLARFDIERDGRHFAFSPERNPLRRDRRTAAGRVLRASASEFNFDRLTGVTIGLQIAGDVQRVVRKRPGRDDQIANGDIPLGGRRTDSDREERHLRLIRRFDGRGRIDARILSAIGNHNHSRQRCVVVQAEFIAESLTKACLDAPWL